MLTVGSVVFLKIQIKAVILTQQIVSENGNEIEKGQDFLLKMYMATNYFIGFTGIYIKSHFSLYINWDEPFAFTLGIYHFNVEHEAWSGGRG